MYNYIIAQLYGSESYNNEKVDFILFNPYNIYKLIKVKDGNSHYQLTMKDRVSAIKYQMNSIQKYIKNTCILSRLTF